MDPRWEKSSFCADKACIEVALIDANTIGVRDGKNVNQPSLRFSREDWASFVDDLAAGRFEIR